MKDVTKKMHLEELKRPSLTMKWAFASSFFIFVVFTTFAVITYKSSVNLFVEKERKTIEKATSEIVLRLENANSQLNLINTYRNLTNSSSVENRLYDQISTIEGALMNIDPFVAELGRTELSLYVYNLSDELVFKTRKNSMKPINVEYGIPSIHTIDERTGFILAEPVYSKETKEKIGVVQVFYELSSFYAIRNRLLFILILVEIISLVLSTTLGYYLSSYFLKPLKLLKATMEKIQKDPQLDIYAPIIDTNDELEDMARIFNVMLDRMRLYTEQQEQFVEDVSHELRTPVAVIEGHLSMLNRWGKDDPEILDESLAASMQEISRMKTLVQEMLDLSRAEQVDVHYGNERTNGKQVVHQVFNNFKMIHPEFVFILDDDLDEEVVLKIYRNHFEQILIIIMDNAVKYSTERYEIHLSISRTMDEFEIAVQDYGEGIAPEDLDKVFNRFYRVDKARARTKGGNGLGLSIAQKLIDSYKGRVTVESSLGQGTIFRIFIPIAES